MGCVEYIGYGYAVLRCGYEFIAIGDRRFVCVEYDTMRELLDAVFKLGSRFWLDDDFARWLRTMFRDFFVYGDGLYCVPIDVKLYEILVAWREFVEQMGIRYIGEIFDCDDFARMFMEFVAHRFKMNAVGRLWGKLYGKDERGREEELGGHAYGWIVVPVDCDYDRVEVQVKGVEPQIAAAMVPLPDGSMIMNLTNYALVYRSYIALG